MKGFFKKINTYSFWVSLSSALLIIVQAVGRPLGYEVDTEVYMSVINSVLGAFVLVGIVPKTSKLDVTSSTQDETQDETNIPTTKDSTKDNKAFDLDEADRQLLISYQRTKQ